jgi:DNA-binding HxlR family transcriptional regulator
VKGYGQFCAVAKALDVLGDRWALLVIRELMLGPRRYTDLLAGLPGVPSSVLTARLRELEHSGVVTRSRVPPPAAATVYELTDDGAAARPIVDELVRWGLRRMDQPEPGEATSASWLTLSLAARLPATFLPENADLELRLDQEVNTLGEHEGRLDARWGAAVDPVAVVESSVVATWLIVTAKIDRRELQAKGDITITGDRRVAESFLDAAHGAWLTERGQRVESPPRTPATRRGRPSARASRGR